MYGMLSGQIVNMQSLSKLRLNYYIFLVINTLIYKASSPYVRNLKHASLLAQILIMRIISRIENKDIMS